MSAPKIHPTALVHPKAKISDGVEIGAFAMIGEHVTLGAGTKVMNNGIIEGHTSLGQDNEVGAFAVIGGKPQDLKYKGEPTKLIIGDRNQFREYVTVNTGTVSGGGETVLGNDCLIMAYCHIAHDCRLGNNVIMANYTGLSGHVIIEDWVILSGMCGVSQFVKVGKHAFVGGMTGVRKDVAPYVITVGDPSEVRGLNLVGLRRRGFEGDRMKAVIEAYKIYFEQGLEKEQALKELDSRFPQQPDVRYLVDFIRKSESGIGR
jgi:UDP-N-acetylglucosamine acyltransferase